MKFVKRLKEPSTWAGFGILVAMFGGSVAPEQIAQIGGGVMAALSIILPEGWQF
jgi:hypothetical protein